MTFRSEFMATLSERGFVHQCTDLDGLDALMAAGPVTAYVGFDATADSLHVGHLLQLMSLRWLRRLGHRPVALLGGGTTQVGDPSFRDSGRPMLGPAEIASNADGIRATLARFMDVPGDGPDPLLLDNADWLEPLRFIQFLREVGTHFTVSRMLSFESVKRRLDREQSLSLLEFNYAVLQAFDFLHLSRSHGCRLQMGGSDQWGNIVNGIELARRIDGTRLFGLTGPLLATADGRKMGKSEGGAVWLSPSRLDAFGLWQWWRNVDDADVGRFLALFTEMPMDEARRLGALRGAEANVAKEALADAAVGLAHGREAAAAARGAARGAFGGGGGAEGLPAFGVPRSELDGGVPLASLLVRCGLAASGNEARRLIAGGGARVNGAKATDPAATVGPDDVVGGAVRLAAGRRKQAAVVPQGPLT